MAQYGFGVGILSFKPPATATDQTPMICGVLQDVSLDISMTTKELRGSMQFPVDATRSAGSISGKAKFAQISAATIGAIMNSEPSTGMVGSVINKTYTPVAGAITLGTIPDSGTFLDHISMVSKAGVLMKKVAATPVKGESFTLTAGTYAVASGEDDVQLTYTYTTTTVGKTVSYSNQLMGAVTTYQLDLHNNFKTRNYGFTLPAVIIPKLAFAPKQDDYLTMDIDFQAMADADNKVIKFFSHE